MPPTVTLLYLGGEGVCGVCFSSTDFSPSAGNSGMEGEPSTLRAAETSPGERNPPSVISQLHSICAAWLETRGGLSAASLPRVSALQRRRAASCPHLPTSCGQSSLNSYQSTKNKQAGKRRTKKPQEKGV